MKIIEFMKTYFAFKPSAAQEKYLEALIAVEPGKNTLTVKGPNKTIDIVSKQPIK